MTAQPSIAGTVAGAEPFAKTISVEAENYARDARRISRRTLERLGAGSGTVYFPRLERKSQAVFWPYRRSGETVNWKACAFPDKAFTSKKGGELIFFNVEPALHIKPERIFITEGEWDAAALIEAGIPSESVISVPNGARERQSENEKPASYGYVEDGLKSGLNRTKRFIWCGDADAPGRALRHDMAKILGAARFEFVEWPEGAKDANDFLRSDGPQVLHELVTEGTQPWPVNGLYRLSDIPEPPTFTLWNPGFIEWGDKVKLAPRTLSVVTGHPGHGKTSVFMQIWAQIVRAYGVGACIASFETRAKPHHRRTLRQLHAGCLEKYLTDAQARDADRWIEEWFTWPVHPDSRPTLEWMLDMAEVAVVRHGARILQIDPWNRLEASRGPQEPETDYIGRCLRQLYAFAHDFNIHVQVLAHPAKMHDGRRGKPPELEDISGSKNWDNMVDQGFVVHRPKLFEDGERQTNVEFYHRKSRFEELGHPCKLDLSLNLAYGHFHTVKKDYAESE